MEQCIKYLFYIDFVVVVGQCTTQYMCARDCVEIRGTVWIKYHYGSRDEDCKEYGRVKQKKEKFCMDICIYLKNVIYGTFVLVGRWW